MSIPREEIDQFLERASTETGLPIERIKTILNMNFKGYSPSQTYNYMSLLKKIAIREEEEREAEEERRRRALIAKWKPVPCPICGAATFGDLVWRNRYTHTPSWVCSIGGHRHYLWAKANEIRAARGEAPIPLEKWEPKLLPPSVGETNERERDINTGGAVIYNVPGANASSRSVTTNPG